MLKPDTDRIRRTRNENLILDTRRVNKMDYMKSPPDDIRTMTVEQFVIVWYIPYAASIMHQPFFTSAFRKFSREIPSTGSIPPETVPPTASNWEGRGSDAVKPYTSAATETLLDGLRYVTCISLVFSRKHSRRNTGVSLYLPGNCMLGDLPDFQVKTRPRFSPFTSVTLQFLVFPVSVGYVEYWDDLFSYARVGVNLYFTSHLHGCEKKGLSKPISRRYCSTTRKLRLCDVLFTVTSLKKLKSYLRFLWDYVYNIFLLVGYVDNRRSIGIRWHFCWIEQWVSRFFWRLSFTSSYSQYVLTFETNLCSWLRRCNFFHIVSEFEACCVSSLMSTNGSWGINC